MNGSHENDPLDQLRHADPQPPDALPSASLARVRARVYEDLAAMTQAKPPRRTSNVRLALTGLVTAILVIGVGVFALPKGTVPSGAGSSASPGLGTPTGSPPRVATPAPSSITGPGAASCVETYNLETLRHRSIAFDGTVAAMNGDEVTFTINHAFRGASAGQVTLTATGMTGTTITSAGGPTLAIGEQYLVAGEEHFAWACGFTQPYDATVSASWAAAFGN